MVSPRKKVFVVDDDRSVRESLALLLKGNFDVACAADGEDALSRIGVERPDLILLDVMMPKLDGIETLRTLREQNSQIPVIMLTAHNTVKSAVLAMKLGATDFLSKPFDIEELTSLIIDTLREKITIKEPLNPATISGDRKSASKDTSATLVGSDPTMKSVLEKIRQVAGRDTTCLITGESGTGKELVARAIHEQSNRRKEPFIAINCSAIPESLIESELFGHEKGAFTNAFDRRIGHFELANKGTLFLDEIGELSLRVQVKLLRFLQEQEFCRVGNSKPIRVDVRIVAATNKNLEELIAAKRFREDLFYRINVIHVGLPPLRERTSDIPTLINHFVKSFGLDYNDRSLNFEPEALAALEQYPWPGNVRELQNTIESLLALCPSGAVSRGSLPEKFTRSREVETEDTQVFEGAIDFEEAQRKFEVEIIEKALLRSNYVQTKAAKLLGISRRILKYKMDKLGIEGEDLGSESE